MDPAALSNLDPKLRETYERVMGTTGSAATPPSPLPDGTTSATAATEPAPATTQDSSTPAAAADSAAPQPPVSPDTLSTPAVDPIIANTATPDQPQTVTIDQPLPNPAASNVITPPHSHGGLLKVFYVLGGAVFFVIYILFWMKILNVSLPF